MKSIIPIIVSVLVTAIASSTITYLVTVEKYEKNEIGETNEDVNNDSFSSRSLTGQAQVITGSSSENAVEIVSAELAQTDEGETAIVVTFVHSRLSGGAEAYFYEFDDNVFQNGVALEKVYSSHFDDSTNWGDDEAEVKAGYSNQFKVGFILNDLESDIVVECEEEDGDYTVIRTFELN